MNKIQPQSLGDILKKFDPLRDKYVSREFQKYGYDLAMELGDLTHKSLYIKMAKETPRVILEKARYFVKDAKARNRGRLFMWKVKELRVDKERKNRLS
ncbi:hypothetical protein COS55_02350 [Candidatus Shapirobacteria bacterium CG03_land_8_20_14_0_80_40_19]|uniref:Uncharacterized protein n=4 Tax=Candidatus Shapironibacteriota TaxID=1752721 RepID=A0A2M7BDP6_9BACT|nr:MAG: hypothetical protein COV89_02270 [Candidatus Shapirobacteria bacterium CG11_big_fil_rev_8_21_14_0_20_40_12]PIV01217.1 MAG: hypothetical protein COS55_02350 [Candidatus Shapirobacteria bacterium CG03_land_8_20_14_0_80_40_19]PJC28587.1 MAG: hypothetical protein CO053_03860 [Candidatus Shapirobacteria bacterium CG_4_9_14_0_2_um_filter_40_11]PJC77536.1 MAG: hypothetical protein CO010_00325 [Candidatus Shapirobacteria bacterium CG_4_8_14_3_um_filter_39_11]